MKTICIYPKIKKDNLYIYNYTKTISDYNVIEFTEFLKKPYLFFIIQSFHFNWYENLKTKRRLEYYLKYLFIYLLRIFNKKIIFTLHNKQSHEFNDFSNRLIELLVNKSDKILVHCNESISYLLNNYPLLNNQKIKYIPHGNYIGNYKLSNENLKERYNLQDEMIYMFLGQVRPYKNIEILVEAFNQALLDNAKLIIVGSCSEEYQKQLNQKYGNCENIIFDFKFIPNEELGDYLRLPDIFVTPYNKSSILNSGSIIMYFSYKKTVISPLIGTLKDMNQNFFYSYDYERENMHLQHLIAALKLAHKDWKKNNHILIQKGIDAYEFVKKEYDWQLLKKDINEIYD